MNENNPKEENVWQRNGDLIRDSQRPLNIKRKN